MSNINTDLANLIEKADIDYLINLIDYIEKELDTRLQYEIERDSGYDDHTAIY